jgi:hypothetical protein
MPQFTIKDRIEITDMPRDSMNQLPGIRQKLVQLRNSARLSKSMAAKYRETLQFLLDSLSEPSDGPEDKGAPTAPVQAKKPAQKTTGPRKATARVDKAKV